MTAVVKNPHWESLGTLESSVMQLVWRHSPVTARDVCDRMTGSRERAYTTIMTTMDRLHRKGLLAREKDGAAWRYAPTMSKVEFEHGLAESVASRILRKDSESALSAFVNAAADLDESLLDRLSQLIRQRRGKR